MHSSLPWQEHECYHDAKPHEVTMNDGSKFHSMSLVLASGNKIIGDITMISNSKGFPTVDNEQEARDNFALIIKAVNSYDALVAALESVINCTASGLSDTRKEVMRNAAAILQKAKE